MDLENSLEKIFKYNTFRPGQKDIIQSILNKNDVVTLMPTGAGKSLCYQLPAIISNGVTIVISPLISLIHDQIEGLKKLGVKCFHLNSTTKGKDKIEMWDMLTSASKRGSTISECKMIYTTPETMINNEDFMMLIDAIYENNLLEGFVIDEAHCVSNWGHDFRPSYLELCTLKEYYPGTPIWAFTATATPIVRQDIKKQLCMESDTEVFKTSFIRENLSYKIIAKNYSNIKEEILELLKNNYADQSGIIYCLSRKDCETYSNYLSANGISSCFYHAKIQSDIKTEIQNKWINNEVKVIVATIAFALGINKPDVRFVIHTAMPKSIESYYQETGRAGRDLLPSDCILFFSYGDKAILDKMVSSSSSENEESQTQKMLQNISSMYNLCNNRVCIKKQCSNYLGEYIEYKCQDGTNKCVICRKKQGTENINMILHAKQVLGIVPRERYYVINIIAKKTGITKINAENLINHMIVKSYLNSEVNLDKNKEILSIGSVSLPTIINPPQSVSDSAFTFESKFKWNQKPTNNNGNGNDDIWENPSVKALIELMENGGLK